MIKYIFCWKNGDIVHIIAPSVDVAKSWVSNSFWDFNNPQYKVLYHHAGEEDYRNPNTLIRYISQELYY